MKIRVSDIGGDGLHIETRRDPRWLYNIPELWSGSEEMKLVSDIDVDIELTKVLREVSVLGNLSFTIEAPCALCLEHVRLDISPDIRLILSPSDKIDDDEDLDHETYRGEDVDLGDYLRELIAVSLPVKVLCREDCKGLCPECGVNLNRETCECGKKWKDPRLAGLEKFKL